MLNGSMKEYVSGVYIADSVDHFSSSYTSSSNNTINNGNQPHPRSQSQSQGNDHRINVSVNGVSTHKVEDNTDPVSVLDAAATATATTATATADTTNNNISNTLHINQLRAIRASENEWAKQLR